MPVGGIDVDSWSLRLDSYLHQGNGLLTVETGLSQGGGEVFITQTGRLQVVDTQRPWIRLNYNSPRWNLSTYYNERDGDQLALFAGVHLFNNDWNYKAEAQLNHDFLNGRARLVAGASYLEERADSAGPDGRQTVYFEAIDTTEETVFAQLDYDASPKLRLVFALRWDDSTLHDAELSPKASLVYQPALRHTLRVTFNQAFQVGNYTEIFLSVPAAAPLDLSAIEAALAPFLGGVPLGLQFVPILAFGNRNLDIEKIQSFEIGYHGVLGARAFLTVDYYRNSMEDFISDLVPGINPSFPPYRAPAALPPEVAAIVEGVINSTLPGTTNGPAGELLLVLSNANTGEVDSQGIELSLGLQPTPRWLVELASSWFDFEVQNETPGAEVNPNAPEYRASLMATYTGERLSGSAAVRWVDSFDWASGVFVGRVPSYEVANLHLSYDLDEHWRVGLSVLNLFDDRHFEAFGGDLLERRALGQISYSW